MRRRFPDMAALLTGEVSQFDELLVRDDETIGRPRGSEKFLAQLERKTRRSLKPEKRGPRPKKGR